MVETGFHSAIYCNGLGIPVVGAKALDRKVNGKTAINVAFVATLSSLTDKPIKTPIHDMAKPKTRRKTKPKVILSNPEDGRHPTTNPVIPIAKRTTTFSAPSPSALPNTTADLEIGSDLNLEINPFCISAVKPTAVPAKVKATVCTNIPGISNWT